MYLMSTSVLKALQASSAFRTSSRTGMDAVAPGLDTAIADALAARESPSAGGIPSRIEEIK